MLTGRDLVNRTVIEEYLTGFVNSRFGSLRLSDLTFTDEIFDILAERSATLRGLGTLHIRFVTEQTLVDKSLYQDIAKGVRESSIVNHKCFKEIGSSLQELADGIVSGSEILTKFLDQCNGICQAIEGELKRKLQLNSVKDEILVYDTINGNVKFNPGSLHVDYRAGIVTLPITKSSKVPFKLSIRCNKPKGSIRETKEGLYTWNNITNGYFHSRTFSRKPQFETSKDKDIKRAYDGKIDTSYNLEYSSTSDNEDFRVTVELTFQESKIDMVNLVIGTGMGDAILSTNDAFPKISRIVVIQGTERKDITKKTLDNVINVKQTVLGDVESRITHRAPDIFPVASYFINMPKVTGIIFEMKCDIPQEIFYPEKIVYDSMRRQIRRLNYFETLVANGFIPTTGAYNPRASFTDTQVKSYMQMKEYSSSTYDDQVVLYRYFAEFKEIEAVSVTYGSTGEVITDDLNTSSRDIAGVELFVNEIIPAGTSIDYFISPNNSEWFQIEPSSRTAASIIPKKITFGDFDSDKSQYIVQTVGNTMYLKIRMRGDGAYTPVLKSYAMRIKLV